MDVLPFCDPLPDPRCVAAYRGGLGRPIFGDGGRDRGAPCDRVAYSTAGVGLCNARLSTKWPPPEISGSNLHPVISLTHLAGPLVADADRPPQPRASKADAGLLAGVLHHLE